MSRDHSSPAAAAAWDSGVSIVSGGVYAGADAEDQRRLTEFGSKAGLAFQIVDDILDMTQDSEHLGKTAGKDVASDKAPSGARGHRVVLTREAAEAALPSLMGMTVDYKAGWDGHDARQKCGIITAAEVDGKKLTVAGYLFARDFPEMEGKIQAAGAMGMSYELADAHVADMRAQVWTLTRATFTGAAILLREKAAYRSTSFRVKRPLAARRAAVAR